MCFRPHPGSLEKVNLHCFLPRWFTGSVWPGSWARRCWLSALQGLLSLHPDPGHLAELMGLRSGLLLLASQSVPLPSACKGLILVPQGAQQCGNPIISCFRLLLLWITERQIWKERCAVCALAPRGVSFQVMQSTDKCMHVEKPQAYCKRLWRWLQGRTYLGDRWTTQQTWGRKALPNRLSAGCCRLSPASKAHQAAEGSLLPAWTTLDEDKSHPSLIAVSQTAACRGLERVNWKIQCGGNGHVWKDLSKG